MSDPLRRVAPTIWRGRRKISCLACGYPMDALGDAGTSPGMRAPEDGDYAICINCGEVSIVVLHPLLGFTLRPATGEELAEFAAKPAQPAAVRRVHQINHRRGGRA